MEIAITISLVTSDVALFQLRVPLVVLGELDGLAKGARQASKYASVEHAAMVAENARLALNFLQQRDSRSGHYLIFFCFHLSLKIPQMHFINLHGGQIIEPSSRRILFSFVLPSNSFVSVSDP